MEIEIFVEGLIAYAKTKVDGEKIFWGCTRTGCGEWTWDIGHELDSKEYEDVLESHQIEALDAIDLPLLQEIFGDDYTEDEEEYDDTIYSDNKDD